MKVPATIALVAGLSNLAWAQSLPACADTCVQGFVSGTTIDGCASLDIKCICSNGNFLSSIACCLAASCSVADQQAAVAYAESLCKSAGVSTIPTAVSCTSTPSSSVAGSSSSTSSGAATSSPLITSPGSSTSSTAATSSTGSTSSVASTAGNNSTVATGSSPTTASGSSSSSSSTSSSAASSSSSAAPGSQNIIDVGVGLVGGLVAFAGLL